MIGLAEGVAHVSFTGGGVFVPARSPYDRQLLVEHVLDRVRSKGSVQVLVDDRRWTVNLLRGSRTARCWSCDGTVASIACCIDADTIVYCVGCAFALRGSGSRRSSRRMNRVRSRAAQSEAAVNVVPVRA